MAYDEELAERIRDLLEGRPGVTEQRMFGGLAFLVDGHMTISASGQGGALVRVDPGDEAALVESTAAEPAEMGGRHMAATWPAGCGSPRPPLATTRSWPGGSPGRRRTSPACRPSAPGRGGARRLRRRVCPGADLLGHLAVSARAAGVASAQSGGGVRVDGRHR